MNLKGKINAALVRDYNKKSVVAHFFNNDITIPIWAIFETLLKSAKVTNVLSDRFIDKAFQLLFKSMLIANIIALAVS